MQNKTTENNKAENCLGITYFEQYELIEAILEQNYTSHQFKTQQLANSLNMSLSTLQRKLKAHTNQTPSKLIYLFRINKAISLMREKESVTSIAHNCGFANSSHNARIIHARMGIMDKMTK